MDQRAFSPPENASLILNFWFDERTAAWDSQVGFEPVEPWSTTKLFPPSSRNPVLSAAAFYTNSNRIEYLLQEKLTTVGGVTTLALLYTYPDGTEVVLDTDRTAPGVDDPGTQYLTYGRFCVVTNGRDRTFKFWGGNKVTSFGFVEAPAAPGIVGVTPKLLVPDSSSNLDVGNNNTPSYEGQGIALIPNIETEEIERVYQDTNLTYQLPSGYTLTGVINSGVVPTPYCYYGLGTAEQLDRNTYSYAVSFISDSGCESPLSPTVSTSWVIPEKHLGGEGEANELQPNPFGIKYGVLITDIPVGGDNVVARRLYRTRNKRDGFTGAGDVFYELVTLKDNVTSQYVDFIPDNELVTEAPGIRETSLIAPNYKYIAAFDGRIWLAGGVGADNTVIYSGAGKPEQFGGFDFFDTGVRTGGSITALAPFGNSLLVFRESAIDLITKSDLAYNMSTLHPTVGTKATNTVQAVPGIGVMFLSDDGIYVVTSDTSGPTVIKISDPVGLTLQRLTPSAIAKSTACYSHANNEYWCHFPADGSQIPNLGVVFHTSIQGWSVRGAAVGSESQYWLLNRLFADRDGDIISAPQTVAVGSTDYLVGLQVFTRSSWLGQGQSGRTTVEGGYTYSSRVREQGASRFWSGWLNFASKGQPFSVDLRCYQSQAVPSSFYALVDRRLVPQTDSTTTAALMNADEYNSTEADAVWDGTGVTVTQVADTGSTVVNNMRLCYVRFDIACRARESFAWGWAGTERLLLQNWSSKYSPHSRQTLRAGD
jgi:hypothetical protein